MTPLLFINVGWQVRYRGPAADDPTLGGHGWLRTHKLGHEAWNFLPYHGKVYGYVPRETTVRLENFSAAKTDETLSGITVVWVARHPSTGNTVIVGWYTDALVYRTSGDIRIKRSDTHTISPQVVAKPDNVHLLPLDQRTFTIPTKKEKGCLGQSPVWYGTDDAFRGRVRAFIARGGRFEKPAKKGGGAGRQSDPEARKRIESAAVRFVTSYYESIEGGERDVDSVEVQCLGWDLDVRGSGEWLRVEVKGLSGSDPIVELTPNEYQAMRSTEHRAHYVVFIVTGLAGSKPKAHIFRYDAKASARRRHVWASQSGRLLRIEERKAARLVG